MSTVKNVFEEWELNETTNLWVAKKGATLTSLAKELFDEEDQWERFKDDIMFNHYYGGDSPTDLSEGLKIGPYTPDIVPIEKKPKGTPIYAGIGSTQQIVPGGWALETEDRKKVWVSVENPAKWHDQMMRRYQFGDKDFAAVTKNEIKTKMNEFNDEFFSKMEAIRKKANLTERSDRKLERKIKRLNYWVRTILAKNNFRRFQEDSYELKQRISSKPEMIRHYHEMLALFYRRWDEPSYNHLIPNQYQIDIWNLREAREKMREYRERILENA